MRADVRIGQRHRETTVGQSDEPQSCLGSCDGVDMKTTVVVVVHVNRKWSWTTADSLTRGTETVSSSSDLRQFVLSLHQWRTDQVDLCHSSEISGTEASPHHHGNQELFIQSRTSAEVHLSHLVPFFSEADVHQHPVKHVFTCNSSKSTSQVSTLHFDMQRKHTELLACSFQHVNMKQRGSCSTSEQDWSPCCSFYWMCCITDSQLMKWVSVTLMSSSLHSWKLSHWSWVWRGQCVWTEAELCPEDPEAEAAAACV